MSLANRIGRAAPIFIVAAALGSCSNNSQSAASSASDTPDRMTEAALIKSYLATKTFREPTLGVLFKCPDYFSILSVEVTDEKATPDNLRVEASVSAQAKQEMTATNIMPQNCIGTVMAFSPGQAVTVTTVPFKFQKWASGWRVEGPVEPSTP